MNCPFCLEPTSVVNSRRRSTRVWRRRNCKNDHTFTTYESVSLTEVDVIKRDEGLEPLQTTKILLSLVKCGITHDNAVELQQTIIKELYTKISTSKQITSNDIAAIVYRVLSSYNSQFADRYVSYSAQRFTD